MLKFIIFLALVFLISPASSQRLKLGSEIGYANVKLSASKQLTLFTSVGFGLEIPVSKALIELSPSFSNFYFNNNNSAGHSQYLTIRSIELATYLKAFIKLSDKSFLYGSLGPNVVYYYQFKTEDHVSNIHTSDAWSSFCFGYAAEAGLRTHVLRRFWFDIGLIDRRDLLTPSVENSEFIKSARRALKISFYISLGKKFDQPGKAISIPKYIPS